MRPSRCTRFSARATSGGRHWLASSVDCPVRSGERWPTCCSGTRTMIGDTEWVTLALAVALVAAFGVTLPFWTRHVRPSFGARLLVAASMLTATTVLVTAALLALPLAGQSDALADYGHWSE